MHSIFKFHWHMIGLLTNLWKAWMLLCHWLGTHVQLRRVVSYPVLPQLCPWDCVFTQFLWYETNVLVNWQLALLPQSGGTEFDRSVQDHLSVPLLGYMRFPVPEIKSRNMYMYIIWICICSVGTYCICSRFSFTNEDNLSLFDSNYFLVPDHQH